MHKHHIRSGKSQGRSERVERIFHSSHERSDRVVFVHMHNLNRESVIRIDGHNAGNSHIALNGPNHRAAAHRIGQPLNGTVAGEILRFESAVVQHGTEGHRGVELSVFGECQVEFQASVHIGRQMRSPAGEPPDCRRKVAIGSREPLHPNTVVEEFSDKCSEFHLHAFQSLRNRIDPGESDVVSHKGGGRLVDPLPHNACPHSVGTHVIGPCFPCVCQHVHTDAPGAKQLTGQIIAGMMQTRTGDNIPFLNERPIDTSGIPGQATAVASSELQIGDESRRADVEIGRKIQISDRIDPPHVVPRGVTETDICAERSPVQTENLAGSAGPPAASGQDNRPLRRCRGNRQGCQQPRHRPDQAAAADRLSSCLNVRHDVLESIKNWPAPHTDLQISRCDPGRSIRIHPIHKPGLSTERTVPVIARRTADPVSGKRRGRL